MSDDDRYEIAVAAALALLDEVDENPSLPKHELFALFVFAFVGAFEKYDEERSARRANEFSPN